MKKVIKFLVYSLLFLIAVFAIVGVSQHEALPEGKEGPEAEALADKMLMALNKPAYDSLTLLQWSFPREHHFVWDKKQNLVNVKWEDYEVDLDPNTTSGIAKKANRVLDGDEQYKAVQKAWSLFANDSFWLVAPYKVRDPGTKRKIVELEGGETGLMVTYSSGGVTPGDSYLWIIGEDGRPKAWKMWVKIIPIGGLKFTWEDWQQQGGAWFAPKHQGPGPASVDLKNLKIQ